MARVIFGVRCACCCLLALVAWGVRAQEGRPLEESDSAPLDRHTQVGDDLAHAEELLQKALDAWQIEKDYDGALPFFNRAVEAAPQDEKIRLWRAHFFESLSELVVESDRNRFRELAEADYAFVARKDPDGVSAGVARDGLARLSGRTLFPGPSVVCPPAAVAAYERAEALFAAGRSQEALADYESATSACPDSARIWTAFADACYMMEDYTKARELFLRSLAIDPWNRMSHRFLADTEIRLGRFDSALRHAALAVISDPTYEAGWATLRSRGDAADRRWRRYYFEKPRVTREPGRGTKQNIEIMLPGKQDQTPSSGADEAGASGEGLSTAEAEPVDLEGVIYGVMKASVLGGHLSVTDRKGKTRMRKIRPARMSALEIERLAVRQTLESLVEVERSGGESRSPFWGMMEEAAASGFLDEAIFLHLMDQDLAAEYPRVREDHRERLVDYLTTRIVSPDDTGEQPGSPPNDGKTVP